VLNLGVPRKNLRKKEKGRKITLDTIRDSKNIFSSHSRCGTGAQMRIRMKASADITTKLKLLSQFSIVDLKMLLLRLPFLLKRCLNSTFLWTNYIMEILSFDSKV
jgi:hypothetical protein